jgi:Ulp1 family protease
VKTKWVVQCGEVGDILLTCAIVVLWRPHYGIGQTSVHDENHYSLFVVVNCGAVCAHIRRLLQEKERGVEEQDSPFPCLLHFDSLKEYHNSEGIARCIRQWLNSEWRCNEDGEDVGEIFTKKTMQLSKPDVPQQPDAYNCGYYVCRFMYNMFRLRQNTFSYREAGVLGNFRPGNGMFPSLITNNILFQFDEKDIKVVRRNLAILILRLGCQYRSCQMERAEARLKRSKPCKD